MVLIVTDVEALTSGLDGEVTFAHQPEPPPDFIPFNLLSIEGLKSAESRYAWDLQDPPFHHDIRV